MNRDVMIVRLFELAFIVALCSACSPDRQQRADGSTEPSAASAAVPSAMIATLSGPAVSSSAVACLKDPSSFVAVRQQSQVRMHAGAPVGTTYVKSESVGEAELMAEAREARVEDAWIFLPERALWIDVGELEKPRSVVTNLDPLRNLAVPANESISHALLYHIHPRSMHSFGPICPPDGVDIYATANLKRALRDRYGITLAARILDGRGRWSYDITTELEEWLRLPDYSGPTVRWIEYPEVRPYYSASRLMMERRDEFLETFERETAVLLGGPGLEARLYEFIRAARFSGVIVSYQEM